MNGRELTLRFNLGRIMQQVMALSALRAVESGSTRGIIGNRDESALAVMAGVALGRVAVALRGYVMDYDPQELTLTVRTPRETDSGWLFRAVEGAVSARLAERDDDAARLEASAYSRLGRRGGALPRLTPYSA